ncbi:hypothetical protein [Deinococcus radiotolerans]|nr:hypothetical protein [Deinococcus radiotolerans]
MKVRFTPGRVRVRIDDLELAALNRGEPIHARVNWPGGGWALTLDPLGHDVAGDGGTLAVGLAPLLGTLSDPAQEGVTLSGEPRVTVEKDFGPQHA